MANSLQDQLLKAGLVNDRQLKKAEKEKRKEHRQDGTGRSSAGELHQRAKEKVERDRELNRARAEAAEHKAIAAQIKQLVAAHRVLGEPGDVPYRFTDEGKVKTINVAETLRQQLINGRLAIVKLDGCYELVPSDVAEKIRVRSLAHLVFWNQSLPAVSNGSDDEYAAYTVPDDLIW